MQDVKNGIRVFVAAFVITLIAAAFFLSVYWINMKAEDSGFEGYQNPISIEKQDDLHYIINAASQQRRIDLTSVDKAAGYFQMVERWIVPQEIRVMTRIGLFAANQLKDDRREAREREFYKNAGLV